MPHDVWSTDPKHQPAVNFFWYVMMPQVKEGIYNAVSVAVWKSATIAFVHANEAMETHEDKIDAEVQRAVDKIVELVNKGAGQTPPAGEFGNSGNPSAEN